MGADVRPGRPVAIFERDFDTELPSTEEVCAGSRCGVVDADVCAVNSPMNWRHGALIRPPQWWTTAKSPVSPR